MGLERPDYMLSTVSMVHVWGHQLELGLPGEGDGLLVGSTGLIVQDLEIN